MSYAVGAIGVSVDVFFADDNGAAVTGKVAADFPNCFVSRGTNTANSAITLSDLPSLTTPHPNNDTAGGIKERGGGVYRFDVPNFVFDARGVNSLIFSETTNKRILSRPIVVGADVNVKTMSTDSITAAALKADAVAEIQSGLSTLAAGAAMSLTSDERTALKTTIWGDATARTLTSFGSLVSDVVSGVWSAATSVLTVSGSIGKWIVDKLDATISSVANQITGLNNLSALANLYGPSVLEIPDSGTTPFAFTLVVRDNEGKLVALDSSPTITAANAAGTDRSANLSAISNPSTGRYTFTYSTGAAHAQESLRITCSGAVSTELRYVEWIGSVVNYDMTTAIQTAATKATEAANQTTSAALQTSMGLSGANLSATLGTLATEASATTNKNAVIAAIPSASTIADAVEAVQVAAHGAGSYEGGSGGSGTGARLVTATVRNSSNTPLENATVRFINNDITRDVGPTNPSGVFVAHIDDGTYTIVATCDGYEGAQQTFVVSGNATVPAFVLSALVISPPATADRTTGILKCKSAGMVVTMTHLEIPDGSTGEAFNGDVQTRTSGGDFYVQFTGLVPGGRYILKVDDKERSLIIPSDAGASCEIPSIVD